MGKLRRLPWVLLLTVAAILVGVRVYLPHAVQRYVNRTLDRLPDYDGHIGDVDLHLWRGAYNIQDIKIVKTTGKVPVPLYSSRNADLSVEWKALFEGKAVGEIEIDGAELNFVSGETESDSQTQVDSEWLQVVKDLFPLRINRFKIKNSTVHYRDFHADPQIDLTLNDVNLNGADFSNTRSASRGLTAKITGNAKAQRHAPLNVKADIEPAAKSPTFNLDLSVKEVKLTQLNDFLRDYANVDAEGGLMTFDVEMAAAGNRFKGYIKPIVKDLKLFRIKKDSDNPLVLVWEGFVGVLAEIFENQRHSQIATRVPFSGSLDDPRAGLWRALGEVFHNAFVDALKGGIEGSIDIGDVKK